MRKLRPFAFALGGVVAAVAIALATSSASGSAGSAGPGPSIRSVDHNGLAAVVNAVAAAPGPVNDVSAQREAAIQQCMAAQGYEYHPIDWAHVNALINEERAQFAPNENSLLSRYGYGITA